MADLIIPIVFPDYKITVETPATRVQVPDMLPFVDILPNDIRVPHTRSKLDNLGHAGVLFINGKTGLTKYYEYGRYDPQKKGWVKKIRELADVRIEPSGAVNPQSLARVLGMVSRKAGHGGRISAAFIEVDNKFDAVLQFVTKRMALNKVPDRKEYDILSYSCVHFMRDAMRAAGLETPWMLDPRPNSYIREIQSNFTALEYSPLTNTYSLGTEQQAVGQ